MLSVKNQCALNSGADSATGFFNRNDCSAGFAQLASEAAPEQVLALIWIALDRLKQINSSCGHQGGDSVITQIARRLRSNTTPQMLWYRMSGDEFLCIAPCNNVDQAQQLATTLLHEIEAPLAMCDLLLHPSASLGIAILEEHEQPSDCLERADRAMNTAKHAGGGRIVTSGSEPLPGRMGIHLARQELELENKLHLAINHNGLNLHYQPCIDFDGNVVALEALMRCSSHNISPGEFIPIAEKTGLIIRLGEWSLLEGARFAHQLNAIGHHSTVSINVSRAQLATQRFPQTLHAALLCARINPELIELELTESLFMDNSNIIKTNLAAAIESGVKIAIDDFGTGFSSLSTLKDIKANKLKIDRAFVVALPHDRRAFAVVKAIAQMGNELGMQIVAEGVETQAQLDTLREIGVHLIQGYIHAHPMPETTLLPWLAGRKTI